MSKQPPSPDNNIEQIRSLIFGPQMEEYRQRFDKLDAEIAALRKEMRDSLTRLSAALDEATHAGQEAREKLGGGLREMEIRFQKLLTETEKRLQDFISEVDTSSAKRLQLADYLMEVSKQLRKDDSVRVGNGEVATAKDE